MEILTAFIREAANQGAVVSDAYMNDTKVWCETILPAPIEIPTRKNGTVVIFAGARFSTSDYGNGSVDMRSFLLNGGDNLFVARNAVEIIDFDDTDVIDVMLGYVKSETAAGREISYSTDGRVKILD